MLVISLKWNSLLRPPILKFTMLRARSLICRRAFVRAYATSPSPHALIFLEHHAGAIESASLSALTAAEQLGGQVTGLIVGGPDEVGGVVEKAKK
jgi:electron transfer flavoprotein alpha subunit